MSLIKLLTVGKCLVSNRNGPGRYRMTELALLPKFAPVGRPIALAPKPKNRAMPAADYRQPEAGPSGNPAPVPMTPTKQVLAHSTPTERAESISPGVNPAPMPVAASASCVNSISNTDFFRLKRVAAAFGRAGHPQRKAPVQTELVLDGVRVVRNDLSDSDVEIVPTRPVLTPAPDQPPQPKIIKAELTGMGWSRLTARLFGSSRVGV
jgi:hypothetical protein